MKKIFTLFIWLLLLPVTALAAAPDGQVIYIGNENVTSGGYWTTDSKGKVTASTAGETPTDNYISYDAENNVLTLHNATIKKGLDYNESIQGGTYINGSAIGVFNQNGDAELTITLEGTNTIAEVGKGIFVLASSASTGSSNLTIQGDGSLNASASQTGIWVQSNSNNAALCVENAEVTASSDVAFKNGVLVQAKDGSDVSLTVNGGSLTASVNANIWFQFGSGVSGSGTPTVTVSNNAIVRANGGVANNSSTSIQYGTGNKENGGIVWNGTGGTVYGNVTLQENLEIGEGESLTIGDGASLNTGSHEVIVNGGTLTGEVNGQQSPQITTPPQSQIVTEGESATFTIEASGSEPLSYQWQESTDSGSNWKSIAGATSTSYEIATTSTDMSDHQYRCVVTASGVSVVSDAATLTVTAKPTYTITAEASPAEGGTATADKTTAAAGETITLIATPSSGYYFVEWKVVSGTVSIQNNKFTMPAENVEVQAVFGLSVTSITLDKTELSLYTGDSETLTATIEPGDATNKTVTWSSDKPGVAAVDASGNVTAVAAGNATITAMADGGKTATCVVQVRKPATVEASGSTNLSFTTDRDEFTLTAIVYGENLSQEPNCWEWTVEDKDVVERVTLRSKAVSYSTSRQAFTIKGTGTTTITATYDDGTYRGLVEFKVSISKPTPPDPISYYNIYVEDVCDGVEVTTSKNVVREGGSVSVYVKKDTANYTFDNFKVYYKRSYYGTWDELKEGTQPGEYPIKNIWTHIYIKAEGAEEKEDPTGIESIEGVKVYTKDGSLYVQTPQREQVIIVSMSGAVVKNEEQVGLKQYHGLQPGIYIVRVGDRAYKLRLN